MTKFEFYLKATAAAKDAKAAGYYAISDALEKIAIASAEEELQAEALASQVFQKQERADIGASPDSQTHFDMVAQS